AGSTAAQEFIASCKQGGTTAAESETAEKSGFDTGITAKHPFTGADSPPARRRGGRGLGLGGRGRSLLLAAEQAVEEGADSRLGGYVGEPGREDEERTGNGAGAAAV
ncbi:hypothetical protein OY671_013155, partial [Metschnikowia pulcherrima]